MFRTPYAGLRYPSLDDLDMNQATLDLLSDIEYRNVLNAARVAELSRFRGVSLKFSGSINMTHGFGVFSQFNDEQADPNGYFDQTVDNTVVNLPKGLWLVATSLVVTCGSDIQTVDFEIRVGGTTVAAVSNGPYVGNVAPNSLTTMIRTTAASSQLQAISVQFNSGAVVGHIVAADLQVAPIGIL